MTKLLGIVWVGLLLAGCASEPSRPRVLATGNHKATIRVNGTPLISASANGAVNVSEEGGVAGRSEVNIDISEPDFHPAAPQGDPDFHPAAPQVANAGLDAGKNPWRGLRKGMTPDEVVKLLGEPVHVIEMGFTTWDYPATASVTFDHGRLTMWDEPRAAFQGF